MAAGARAGPASWRLGLWSCSRLKFKASSAAWLSACQGRCIKCRSSPWPGQVKARTASTAACSRAWTESSSPVPVAVAQTETANRPLPSRGSALGCGFLSLDLLHHQLTVKQRKQRLQAKRSPLPHAAAAGTGPADKGIKDKGMKSALPDLPSPFLCAVSFHGEVPAAAERQN